MSVGSRQILDNAPISDADRMYKNTVELVTV